MNCFINVFLVIGTILLGIITIIWLVQGFFIVKKSLNNEENDFVYILRQYKHTNTNKNK